MWMSTLNPKGTGKKTTKRQQRIGKQIPKSELSEGPILTFIFPGRTPAFVSYATDVKWPNE